MEMKVYLKGLTCANCAGKIEEAVSRMKETGEVSINLMRQEMTVGLREGAEPEKLQTEIGRVVHKFEPDVEVLFHRENLHSDGHHEGHHCHDGNCCHEHTHTHEDMHEHEHEHGEALSRTLFLRFGAGLAVFLAAILLDGAVETVCFLAAYLIFGYDVLLRAVKNIARGQVFIRHYLPDVAFYGWRTCYRGNA